MNFLFLTRTCVNGLIRYNKSGEFNNSLHHTRKGIHPDRLEKVIFEWSTVIQKYIFENFDYKKLRSMPKKEILFTLTPLL